jgi:hypothetical protein
LSKESKNLVTEVNRKNDIMCKLAFECSMPAFVVYMHHRLCASMRKNEICIIGNDMNGHVGRGNETTSQIRLWRSK